MNKAYLLIGGNMGNREGYLAAACTAIESRGSVLLQRSSLYETAAWGKEDQSPFLNQALLIETPLPPHELMKNLLLIEKEIGRTRDLKYGPRTIDIDILFFNDAIIADEFLSIPHPQLHRRRFVLVPLAEIAPDHLHPTLHKSVSQLLAECADPLDVHKIS